MRRGARLVLRVLGVVIAAVCVAQSAQAVVYTVINTANSGAGSLRQALLDADANAGYDSVYFSIPGAAIPDPNGSCPNESTDVDCSTFTDIIDIVKIVNVAFRNANPATEFCNPCP